MSDVFSEDPFPHWVIDDFLPEELALAADREFFHGPGAWTVREHLYSRNKRTRAQGCGDAVEAALVALESQGMCAYLAALTKPAVGIEYLHADPQRFGGGQHLITRGGRLGIHADFTHHPVTKMRRRLNVLVYLNRTFSSSGSLQLWKKDMSDCKGIYPSWNRAVLFETTSTSFHGHPDPLQDQERRSLAAYYYTTNAVWMDAKYGRLKTTDYRPRPWEYKLRVRRWLSKKLKGG